MTAFPTNWHLTFTLSLLLVQGWAYDPNLSGQKKNDSYVRWKCRDTVSHFLYQMRREQGTSAATGSHPWLWEFGQCWWQREEWERTWILVKIIELQLMAFCLESSLPLVFQLENLQVYLLFNPLWIGVSETVWYVLLSL